MSNADDTKPIRPMGALEFLTDEVGALRTDVQTLLQLFMGDPNSPDTPGWLERVRRIEGRLNTTDEYIRGEKDSRKFYSRLVIGALLTNLVGLIFIFK